MELYKVQLVSMLVVFLCVNFSQVTTEEIKQKRYVKGKKFGFFGGIAQIGKLAYDQYSDTTKTLQSILDILNDSFSDTATKAPPSATPSSVTNETTTERYRISRNELGRILNRNFRGLQKLLNIELNDAFNQTKYTIADYKAEFYKTVKKPKTSNNDIGDS